MRRGLQDLDGSMLVINHEGRAAAPNRARRNRLIVGIVIPNPAEVGVYLAIPRPRIQLKTRFVGQVNLDLSLAVLHLHAAQPGYADFHRAIRVGQMNVSRHSPQVNVFSGFRGAVAR